MAQRLRTVRKWGLHGQSEGKRPSSVRYRPGTTDEKVIDEVLCPGVYQRPSMGLWVEPSDAWLDLGANIRTFSLPALSLGASSVAVEPEPKNRRLTTANLRASFPGGRWSVLGAAVGLSDRRGMLYLANGEYNKYRHSTHMRRKRTRRIPIRVRSLASILAPYADLKAIKMDIEGAEIELLEDAGVPRLLQRRVAKLVFEYTFDHDPSVPRFRRIVRALRRVFPTVQHKRIPAGLRRCRFYPPSFVVHCQR